MSELTDWLRKSAADEAEEGRFDSEARMLEAARELDRLAASRDEARQVARNLYRFLSHHEAVPEIDERYGWLIEAAEKARE